MILGLFVMEQFILTISAHLITYDRAQEKPEFTLALMSSTLSFGVYAILMTPSLIFLVIYGIVYYINILRIVIAHIMP